MFVFKKKKKQKEERKKFVYKYNIQYCTYDTAAQRNSTRRFLQTANK